MTRLPLKGALSDQQLDVIEDAGILVIDGLIERVDTFGKLYDEVKISDCAIDMCETPMVLLPGFIDAHTHICYAGSRFGDYAMRTAGKSYREIAGEGGGIWYTVQKTRESTEESLSAGLLQRTLLHLNRGVTTVEVKSGYGLTIDHEIKMLRVIKDINRQTDTDLIPTCLAAHIPPEEYLNEPEIYLQKISTALFSILKSEKLTNRIDIYVDDGAFTVEQARPYLKQAKRMSFDLTVHADQFSTGGSALAVEKNAHSADHLEASGMKEIELLSKSNVIPVALPGSSIGLGMPFAPARKLLDSGASLVIASDWNPGSAPMGDLLTLAAVIGIYEKLSSIEILSAITFRAAAALGLPDRGILENGSVADMIAFPCNDYREILYHQGTLKPDKVWKNGKRVK